MNVLVKFVAYLRLREAVNLADKAHAETGQRYYVVPSANKLVILDRKNFRILKHKNYINYSARVNNLIVESFYFTPYRNGDGYLSRSYRKKKIMQYFDWVKATRKAKKERKNAKANKKA